MLQLISVDFHDHALFSRLEDMNTLCSGEPSNVQWDTQTQENENWILTPELRNWLYFHLFARSIRRALFWKRLSMARSRSFISSKGSSSRVQDRKFWTKTSFQILRFSWMTRFTSSRCWGHWHKSQSGNVSRVEIFRIWVQNVVIHGLAVDHPSRQRRQMENDSLHTRLLQSSLRLMGTWNLGSPIHGLLDLQNSPIETILCSVSLRPRKDEHVPYIDREVLDGTFIESNGPFRLAKAESLEDHLTIQEYTIYI